MVLIPVFLWNKKTRGNSASTIHNTFERRIRMDLNRFMFPVEERPVAIHDGVQDIMDIDNRNTFLSADFMCCVLC